MKRYTVEKHIDGYTIVDTLSGETITDGKPHNRSTTYYSRKADAEKRMYMLEMTHGMARAFEAVNSEKPSRDELELAALWTVSPDYYYDLADNIDSTSDSELYAIIEANGDPEKEAALSA